MSSSTSGRGNPLAKVDVRVTRRGADPRQIKAALKAIAGSQVYVGIPAADSSREGSGDINNAELLYLHTNGVPSHGIPARPVIEPSIEKSKPLFTPELAGAARAILNGNPASAMNYLNRAGTIAANGAKRYFTDPANGWAPNAPSTIREKGSSRPLINTAQMRRAITHVVSADLGNIERPSQPTEKVIVDTNPRGNQGNKPTSGQTSIAKRIESAVEHVAEETAEVVEEIV